jgi:hypothetical protein
LIFVSVYGETTPSDTIKSSNLNQIVDLYEQENILTMKRSNDDSADVIISDNFLLNNKLTFCLPKLDYITNNYDFSVAFSNGTQFVAMEFQNKDDYLELYNKFFKISAEPSSLNSSFIKKPDHMINFDTPNDQLALFSSSNYYLIGRDPSYCSISVNDEMNTNMTCEQNKVSGITTHLLFSLEQDKFLSTSDADNVFYMKNFNNDEYCKVDDVNNDIVNCNKEKISEGTKFIFTPYSSATDGKNGFLVQDRNTEKYCHINGDVNFTCEKEFTWPDPSFDQFVSENNLKFDINPHDPSPLFVN